MFVGSSVSPSVCLSGTGVHCDHTVHSGADVSSRLDSQMLCMGTLAAKHVQLFPADFLQFHLEERWGGMDVQTKRDISRTIENGGYKLLLSANRKSCNYAASIGTTTDGRE